MNRPVSSVPRDTPHPAGPATRTTLLNAALRLIVERGLHQLTLRPLAEAAGVSTATISHHLGTKADILPQLIAHGQALDEAFFAVWRGRARMLPPGSSLREELVRSAVQAWCTPPGQSAALLAETVQSHDLDAASRNALAEWTRFQEQAWIELTGSQPIGFVLARMLVDEAAFVGSLADISAYALLRDLIAKRLFSPRGADGDLYFKALQSELEPEHSLVDAARNQGPRQRPIADAAAQIIVERGIGALNHRSVAALAGVSPAGVVHHFKTRENLVQGGLEAVLANFQAWLQEIRADSVKDPAAELTTTLAATSAITRATHAIGTCAQRFQDLRPHAADMRRRRGQNVRAEDYPTIPTDHGKAFYKVTAQLLSVTIFGDRMLAMARQSDEVTSVRQTIDHLTQIL